MKTKIFLLVLLFLTISCDKNENTEQETNLDISFVNIGKGALYGAGAEGISQENFVITNSTDWDNLMNQMNSINNVTDSFSETSIDFNDFMLIVIILEVKSNGWAVEIININETSSEILVSKQEMESITAVVTQPFHIVKIPKTSKPIAFQ